MVSQTTVSYSCSLELVIPRPVSAVGCLRPTSVFARMVAQSGDPRYMVWCVVYLIVCPLHPPQLFPNHHASN